MEPESAIAAIRALLKLPPETGERFAEEWKTVRRRIEVVHGVRLPPHTEPAGAPRLQAHDEAGDRPRR